MVDLAKHIFQKAANRDWLYEVLQGDAAEYPYRPCENGEGRIGQLFRPSSSSSKKITARNGSAPFFVVNIPMGHIPSRGSTARDYSEYLRVLNTIKNEALSTTASASSRISEKNLAVVIGINQIESIDPAYNRSFKRYIRDLPFIEWVVHRSFGFFWKPEWNKTVSSNQIYPRKKAYRIVKAISSKAARKVRTELEQPKGLHPNILSQIPFQQIRETIKNSRFTREFFGQAHELMPKALQYLLIMDADFSSLRKNGEAGLVTKMSALIQEKAPFMVSLGYRVSGRELPVIRHAVRLDMLVREATASIFPYGVYYPEPATAVQIPKNSDGPDVRGISFIGGGRALESRRIMQSAPKSLSKQGALFIAGGGVATTTPARMKTEKNLSYTSLTKEDLKTKAVLQAFRGLPQSHIHPKKWADNLYVGLGIKASRVTDVTTPLMQMFGFFDPISRMFRADRFSTKVFDRVIEGYRAPLNQNDRKTLDAIKSSLWCQGLSKPLINKIQKAAQKAGLAIYNYLLKTTN